LFFTLLVLQFAAAQDAVLTASFVNSTNTLTKNVSLQGTSDEKIVNSCFLSSSDLAALAGSRVSIEGGGLITSGGGGGQVIQVEGTVPFSSLPGSVTNASSGLSSGSSSGSYAPNPARNVSVRDALPEVLSGRMIDEDGRPLGGVLVELAWIDERGESHTVTVKTLTLQEALLLGDSSLEGYYFVNRGRFPGLTALSTLTMRRLFNTTGQQNAQPLSSRANTAGPGMEYVPVLYQPQTAFQSFVIGGRDFIISVARLIISFWWFFLLLAFAVIFWFFWQSQYGDDLRESIRTFTFSRRRFVEHRARDLLARDFYSVSSDRLARDLLGEFIRERRSFALVIDDNALLGIVTANDLLGITFNEKGLKAKAKEFMTRDLVTVEANASFSDVVTASLKGNARVIPVLKGGAVAGVITREVLLAEYDRYFSLDIIKLAGMPLVKELMQQAILLEETDVLAPVIQRFKDENLTLAVVTGLRELQTRKVRELRGVLTEHELLEELYNYRSLLEKMDAGRIMAKNVKAINGGITLYEANKIMIDTGFRALPVTYGEEIAGVLTQQALLQALRDFVAHARRGD